MDTLLVPAGRGGGVGGLTSKLSWGSRGQPASKLSIWGISRKVDVREAGPNRGACSQDA